MASRCCGRQGGHVAAVSDDRGTPADRHGARQCVTSCYRGRLCVTSRCCGRQGAHVAAVSDDRGTPADRHDARQCVTPRCCCRQGAHVAAVSDDRGTPADRRRARRRAGRLQTVRRLRDHREPDGEGTTAEVRLHHR